MYTLTKLSLATSLIILMAFVAETFNILDRKYTTIMMIAAVVIQAVLLCVLVVIMIMRRGDIRGVKITRYKFNDRFIKRSDYILPGYVSITNPRKSAVFEILLEIKDENEPPEITISKKGVTLVRPEIKDLVINVNSGITGDSFMLDADIIVKPGEEINFQLKKDTLVKSFFLGEFYVP